MRLSGTLRRISCVPGCVFGTFFRFWLLAAALLYLGPRQPLACAAFNAYVARQAPSGQYPFWVAHATGRPRWCLSAHRAAAIVCRILLSFNGGFSTVP